MQAIEQKGIRDRVAINTQTAKDLAEIQRQGYANQQKSEDRIFGNFSDATRGVESFRNPSTGETFEVSNLYGRAWVNARNEVYLTDQTGADPNVLFKGGTWTALEPVKR
jgi:nucleoid DNA-binding protein